jgi:hypothetical protein
MAQNVQDYSRPGLELGIIAPEERHNEYDAFEDVLEGPES